MKKIYKKFAILSILLTFSGAILPTIFTINTHIHATEIITPHNNKKISEKEFYKFVDKGVKEYHLSYDESERLTYIILRDNLDFLYIESRGAFWTDKGITVEGMAFVIDGILGWVVGSAFKSVLFDLYRNHQWEKINAITRTLKNELIKKGFAPIAHFVEGGVSVLSFVLDPGLSIAKAWDARDKYPNNGHINLEFW